MKMEIEIPEEYINYLGKRVMDEYQYRGFTIREWVDKILNDEPTADVDKINIKDLWICHHKEKPKNNVPCFVLIFESLPFIGVDYQLRVMTYDSSDDTYTDVINGLKKIVDSPVCTYWRYAHWMEESISTLKAENVKE